GVVGLRRQRTRRAAPDGVPRARGRHARTHPRAGAQDLHARSLGEIRRWLMDADLRDRIQGTIDSSKVVLFMKGSKNFPQCGFSAQVVQILMQSGVDCKDVNILTDPDIRQGLKEYSNWPTFPQLYVGGQFVGGCDIVMDLFQSGELQNLLGA